MCSRSSSILSVPRRVRHRTHVAAFGLAVAVLSASDGLRAQVLGARLATRTTYGAFVTTGGRTVYRALPKNSQIGSPGTSLTATAPNASAATRIGWRVRSGIASCDVSEQGFANASATGVSGGSTASTNAQMPTQGAHELSFEIVGKPGTRGLVEIWASGIASSGSGAKYGVDVGDDGRFDFTASIGAKSTFERIERSGTIAKDGVLRIRLVSSAAFSLRSGSLSYKTGVSLRFTPGVACDFVRYGRSCGPVLTGRATTTGSYRTLDIALASKSPRTPGVLVLGNQRLAIAFGTCWLNTNYLAALAYVTDASGASPRRFTINTKTVLSLTLQDVLFPGGTRLASSNGLELICR